MTLFDGPIRFHPDAGPLDAEERAQIKAMNRGHSARLAGISIDRVPGNTMALEWITGWQIADDEINSGSIANYRVATPTNSIEQPHQSKIPTQPQGEGS